VFASTTESGSDLFPHLIEHMYKECLHNLRPKLKLFKSYEKTQEEVEKLRQQLYPNLGEVGDGDGKALGTINENESEDYTSEALMESDEENLKPRSENEELPDDEGAEEDEEENSQMDEKPPEKSEEDLQFEAMFEKMATDSYQERIKESSKVNTRDIPVPMSTRSAKKTYDQLQESSDSSKSSNAVPFVLMVRNTKSGKQQFKNFVAPLDSELAVNLKLQEQKIKEENEKVKRLTLNITERLEEEDYLESMQKSPAFSKRPKYRQFKHQFGVPDTDNIFH
jgi:regulator of nonsense transcripts 2